MAWFSRCSRRLLLSVLFLAGVVSAGGGSGRAAEYDPYEDDAKPIRTLKQLSGSRLGVLAGTVLDASADKHLDFTQFVYFDDSESQVAALLAGEIDAFLEDEPVARYLASSDARLFCVPGTLDEDRYGFALRKEDEHLYDQVNGEVGKIMTDGTLEKLTAKWLDASDDDTRVMPPGASAEGRILRLGVSPVSAPFAYRKNGRVIGMDVELIQTVAERLDMQFVVVPMEFSNLIVALLDGTVDVIGSCMSITEEREKQVRFTDSYYQGGVTAVVLR